MPAATTHLCCHPTNDSLLLTSSEDKCLRVWDVRHPPLTYQLLSCIDLTPLSGALEAPRARQPEVRLHKRGLELRRQQVRALPVRHKHNRSAVSLTTRRAQDCGGA